MPPRGSPREPAKPTTTTARRRRASAQGRSAPTTEASAPYDDRPWLAAYPSGVPADYDLPAVSVTQLLDDAAAAFPTRAAVAFLGTTTSYRELRSQAGHFAAALVRLGVRPGDRVALVLPNCPQFVVAFYAVLRAGAVVTPMNPLGTQAELHRQLADSGAVVAICLDKNFATVEAAGRRTALEHVVVSSVFDYLPAVQRSLLRLPLPRARRRLEQLTARLPRDTKALSFVDLLRSPAALEQVAVEPDSDLATLQYTGGTTGVARGAMLTHANLVANAYQTRLWYADARAGREVTLGVLPLFHTYGLTLCLTTTTLLAGTLVLLPRFDIDGLLAAIDEHRPTLFPGVPPIYKALVDSPKARRHDLQSIRACVSGAMRLPPETQEQFERVTGGRLVEGYGMTETSPVTHANPLVGKRKPGTIGIPVPNTRCRIVDPDDRARVVDPGQPGELAIAGPQVFKGYWGDADDVARADLFTADGYLLTGDIATMDDEGFFTLVDRKKELIIAGGFNIYPSEVEEALLGHPGIVDACVIGVPDRYRGETVKAFVVLDTDADLTTGDVLDHCTSLLTAYKVPRQVEFRDQLPRTPVGKLLRHELRAEELAKQSDAGT